VSKSLYSIYVMHVVMMDLFEILWQLTIEYICLWHFICIHHINYFGKSLTICFCNHFLFYIIYHYKNVLNMFWLYWLIWFFFSFFDRVFKFSHLHVYKTNSISNCLFALWNVPYLMWILFLPYVVCTHTSM